MAAPRWVGSTPAPLRQEKPAHRAVVTLVRSLSGQRTANLVLDLVPVSARPSASHRISTDRSGGEAACCRNRSDVSPSARHSGAVGRVTPQCSRTRLPGSAHRAADVIMDSRRRSEKPLCGPSLRTSGTRVCSLGLGFIRPARPSKRASVAASAAGGGRRPLRPPRRRASGSSSAPAHEAARKPQAHRSSGVP